MWDTYEDDDSFQKLAQVRGFHDGILLARVLYGKQAVRDNQERREETNKERAKAKNVQFRREEGRVVIDPAFRTSTQSLETESQEFDYLWRCQDYSYKPVKKISEYMETEEGVKTDVIIFNREDSSEFDIERETLKDDLLAWNERYKKRREDKISGLVKS